MKQELRDKFTEQWPTWFLYRGYPISFDCGDGWFDLLYRLCAAIAPFVEKDFSVAQVKEKFGGLRFYPSAGCVDVVWDCVRQAENDSFKICEECGNPGALRGGSWLRTLCDEHSNGRKPLERRDSI